jgi:hypothetical protein
MNNFIGCVADALSLDVGRLFDAGRHARACPCRCTRRGRATAPPQRAGGWGQVQRAPLILDHNIITSPHGIPFGSEKVSVIYLPDTCVTRNASARTRVSELTV